MAKQVRKRGVDPKKEIKNNEKRNKKSIEKQENKRSKFQIKKLVFFIPLLIIVLSGVYFKNLFPLFQNIINIVLIITFIISYMFSYYGATGRLKIFKVIFTFLNICLMIIFMAIGFFTFQLQQGIGSMTLPNKDVEVEVEPKKVNVKKDTFNVLISGTDTRADTIDSPSRSDVIMVATINPKSGKVLLTSLPRDTYYPLTCTGTYDKLTHASQFDMGCLVDTVEDILDIKINYYLKANFYAVINLIDAVGGITVDVEDSFCGQDENDVKNAYCFAPGAMEMSGAQALSYARERKSFADGDYARAKHQQDVIDSFMKKVMLNPGSIPNLIDVSASSVRTNMSSGELLELTNSFANFETEGYVLAGYGQIVDIPSEGLYGTSVQVLTDTSIAEAKTKINDLNTK